jgi:hypothetical protein
MPYYTNTVLTTSTATTTNNLVWGNNWYSDPLTFRYEPSYKVPPEVWAEGAPKPENDMAWLKRRVDEIRWVPA